MLKISVKYFLNKEGLDYFPTWYDEVFVQTRIQDGYRFICKKIEDMNPVICLYFENLTKLEKWSSTQTHDDLAKKIEGYFIQPKEVNFEDIEDITLDHVPAPMHSSINSIGIVIPTFNAAKHLPHCLPPLLQSPLKPRVLVIDSSSTDNTVAIAQSMGAETMIIPQKEFNHGATREKGRKHLDTSIVIMLTQDAYATSPDMIETLIAPLVTEQASIAYARQLPHKDAGFFAAFAREFNYPNLSHIRSLNDLVTYGAYTFFCSNSCAAYLNSALDEVEGFPPVLFGEDSVVTAKLLHRKHRIAYVAEAQVHHSHDYTLKQEFCRHFDMGMARQMHRQLLSTHQSENQRGKDYVKALLKELWQHSPSLIPYACLQTLMKWGGYRLGSASVNGPTAWKKFFSSQKNYW